MPCVENDVICCTTWSSPPPENVGGVNEREDNERSRARAFFNATLTHDYYEKVNVRYHRACPASDKSVEICA